MIAAQVDVTQAVKQQRQFVARTGSGHHLILDDAAGGTGPKPIEMVAVGLAGCTAFDVITILRQKYHQKVTGYQVRVEADQAERPPQVFTAIRIHHVVAGIDIDSRWERWCKRQPHSKPPTKSSRTVRPGCIQPSWKESSIEP